MTFARARSLTTSATSGVALAGGRGCKQLFGLVQMLVGTHALGIELVDRDLHLGNLEVVEGLSVSGSRRPAGSGIFKQYHNPLRVAHGDVEDVPQGVTFEYMRDYGRSAVEPDTCGTMDEVQ